MCYLHVLQTERKDKQAQNAARHTKILNAYVMRLFFVCVVGKNRKTPKLSPVADNAITRGSIGMGSLVYICGFFRESTAKCKALS